MFRAGEFPTLQPSGCDRPSIEGQSENGRIGEKAGNQGHLQQRECSL
jgi:hypothetical protein